MTQQHYNNAPIVEAVIDIQTLYKEPPNIGWFDICRQKLSDKFPISTPIQMVEMGMSPLESAANGLLHKFNHSQTEVGWRLSSERNDRILQLQQRGFTYSHLPPYTNWSGFSTEARNHWDIFFETCKPVTVSRCAVRFINRITIPMEKIKISDYFNLYPNIPETLSQEVNGMFMQFQMPLYDLVAGAMAITNFAMAKPDKPNSVTIVLDFDLFCTKNFEPNSSEIWDVLNLFRARKNVLFEACITDEVRRLIL